MQAFVVARDGKVLSRCPGGKAGSASGMGKWLEEQLREHEKAYPRTAFRFERPDMDLIDGRPASESFMAARKEGKPILLYVCRETADEKDRTGKKEVKACRKFEKRTLKSKKAAAAAEGYVLYKVDLAGERETNWARTKGITRAPTLYLYAPGKHNPVDLTKVKGPSLVYHLKKHKNG